MTDQVEKKLKEEYARFTNQLNASLAERDAIQKALLDKQRALEEAKRQIQSVESTSRTHSVEFEKENDRHRKELEKEIHQLHLKFDKSEEKRKLAEERRHNVVQAAGGDKRPPSGGDLRNVRDYGGARMRPPRTVPNKGTQEQGSSMNRDGAGYVGYGHDDSGGGYYDYGYDDAAQGLIPGQGWQGGQGGGRGGDRGGGRGGRGGARQRMINANRGQQQMQHQLQHRVDQQQGVAQAPGLGVAQAVGQGYRGYAPGPTQFIPIPMGGGGGEGIIHSVGPQQQPAPRGEGIRITNKQTVNERSRRRRAASKDKKSRKKRASKDYMKIKKQVMAKVRASRTAEYKSISKNINKLPIKQRKSARDRARKALMKRQKEHFAKLKPDITSLERLRGLLKRGVQWTR